MRLNNRQLFKKFIIIIFLNIYFLFYIVTKSLNTIPKYIYIKILTITMLWTEAIYEGRPGSPITTPRQANRGCSHPARREQAVSRSRSARREQTVNYSHSTQREQTVSRLSTIYINTHDVFIREYHTQLHICYLTI